MARTPRGKRKVVITPDVGEPREYLIPRGKHISVREGDYVRAGEPLMDGSSNPHDILGVLGEKELAKSLVDAVQEIYRLQGVRIHDKHIEVIVRQMMRRVTVTPGRRFRFSGRRAGRKMAIPGGDRKGPGRSGSAARGQVRS